MQLLLWENYQIHNKCLKRPVFVLFSWDTDIFW